MAGTYELWLTDDKGARLVDLHDRTMLDAVLSFACTRVVNGIGWFTAALPNTFDTSLLSTDRMDRMLQVWRAPEGGRLALWRVYFVRKWRYRTVGAEEFIDIAGPDVNDLLRRRVVLAYSGTTGASKSDAADNMMKEVVTESISDSTNPAPDEGTRVWSDLSVQADLGNGPTISKSFAFKRLLLPSGGGALAAIARAARAAGTEVFFDIVPATIGASTITFEFQTYTGQPGQDVTGQFVFAQEFGNLQDPELEFDYTQEVNVAYGAGQKRGEARNVQQEADATRYNASQWNRCEAVADARRQSSDAGVTAAAQNRLTEGLPVRRMKGTLIDTDGVKFGADWGFGDKIRTRYRGFEFDAIIRATTLGVDGNGREQVLTAPDFEELVA